MSSAYYSPSPHRPSLPLTSNIALPSVPTLGSPQTPLSTPQSHLTLPTPLLAMAQQQGGPPTSQPNLYSFQTPHSLPLSQVQPTPYPHSEQELAEQPIQVNI